MEPTTEARNQLEADPARYLADEINRFVRESAAARLDFLNGYLMWDDLLVRFADGDDLLFAEYKRIIGPDHLTPREALATAGGKQPDALPRRLSVISWVLPITGETRESNRTQTSSPSRLWSHTRWYGEKSNDALKKHVEELLTGMGYLAAAPSLQRYFKMLNNEKGPYSNWSERHVAYAAGQGTFGLSDGLITERGIAHRCGSVVTDLVIPPSARTAAGPYANCLFYAGVNCRACINRCPAKAITEAGHDKNKCQRYLASLGYSPTALKGGYDNATSVAGCGLCQTKVPCEATNPTRQLKKRPG